jgi:pseudouridine synthase
LFSTYGDPWNRPNLNKLKEQYSFFNQLHPVGRLDADSSGLLLFSKDGKLTQHLLNPRHSVEREYDCLVLGEVNPSELKEKLSKGVETSSGSFPAHLVCARSFSSNEDLEYFHSLISQRNVTLNVRNLPDNDDPVEQKAISLAKCVSLVRLSVTEGKYRMIRRILHNSGHSVCFLRRRRYGMIYLHPEDDNNKNNNCNETAERKDTGKQLSLKDIWPIKSLLKEDSFRSLTPEEKQWVKEIIK